MMSLLCRIIWVVQSLDKVVDRPVIVNDSAVPQISSSTTTVARCFWFCWFCISRCILDDCRQVWYACLFLLSLRDSIWTRQRSLLLFSLDDDDGFGDDDDYWTRSCEEQLWLMPQIMGKIV